MKYFIGNDISHVSNANIHLYTKDLFQATVIINNTISVLIISSIYVLNYIKNYNDQFSRNMIYMANIDSLFDN